MTMPTYFPMTNNIDTYINNLNNQRAGLEKLVNFKNNHGNTAAYEDFSDLMQEYTYNPNQTPLWEGTQNMLHTYINKGNDYVQAYGDTSRFTPTALNHKKIDLSTLGANNNTPDLSKPVDSTLWNTAFYGVDKHGSPEDRAKIAGMQNTLENYQTLNKMYEDVKPGFFGNIWNNILEEPGAFTKSALSIWNSIRANDLAKDYSKLMKDSFNLQKQQYLDREDRAKKEFAALQSRRAGSSL